MRYDKFVIKVLVDYRGAQLVEEELSGLRYEIEEYKRPVHRVPALHCTSGLYMVRCHLQDHLVQDLERFESMSCTDEASFEHFHGLA